MILPAPLRALCVSMATIAGSFSGAVAGPAPMTREAFVERVLRTSPAVASIDARVALGRAGSDAAGRWSNPEVGWQRSAAVSGRRADESEDELTLRLPLVLSGRLGLEREAARASAEAEASRGRGRRVALAREARLAFDAVWASRARVAVLDDASTAVQEARRIVLQRALAGESTGYEGQRMEFEAALLEDLRVAAVAEQARAESRATAMLGANDTDGAAFETDPTGAPDPALPPEPPIAASPEVEALEHDRLAAEAEATAAGRRGVPEPTLTAGAQWLDAGEAGQGAAYVVGVSVPLPVFDAGRESAAVASARAHAARTERAERVRLVETERSRLRAELQARRARRATHQEAVLARAERLRELAIAAWKAGGIELPALLDAHRAFREARLSSLELTLDARNTETELLFILGIDT